MVADCGKCDLFKVSFKIFLPLQMSLEGTNCPFVQTDSVAPSDANPLPQVNKSLSDCLYAVLIGDNDPFPSMIGVTGQNISAQF